MSELQRVQKFLYLLARDELPFGAVMNLVKQVEAPSGEPIYTNMQQAAWALETARRLLHDNY